MKVEANKLVKADELLKLAWDQKSRPSLHWLRQHSGKEIPVVRIGRLCFYSVAQVKSALNIP